jgi:enoyl-CoA hydratase/carnithine racemase
MVAELVETTVHGRVLVVSMQREAKRNAVNRDLADAIDRGLSRLDDDDDLWVGVLTGTSNVFSAGSDLASAGDYVTDRGGEYGVIRRDRRKPLIAAVEGIALGGGFEIVLACDLVVAARSARFGLPEVCRGLIPSCGALFRGPRALPLNLAREMILTGAPVDAARLHAMGVVNVLTDDGGALDAAIGLAQTICANAPLSVQACLRAINSVATAAESQGWAATEQAVRSLSGTHDLHEGVRAFFEKRPPEWTGR